MQRDATDRGVALVAALVGALGALVLSRDQVRFDPDSAAYLRAAELLAGDPGTLGSLPSGGLIDLPGTWPPGYAVLLASLGAVTDGVAAARWIGIASAAATFGGLALLVGRQVGTRATIATLVAIVTVRGMLQLPFAFALSEGPYLALLVWSLVVLAPTLGATQGAPAAWRTTWRSTWLRVVGAGALLGAAASTRYVGVAAVAAVAGVLAWRWRRSPRLAGAAVATLASLGLAPVVAWTAATAADAPAGSRRLGWTPRGIRDLDLFGDVLDVYLPGQITERLPGAGAGVLGAVVVAGAAAATLRWIVGASRREDPATARVVGLLLAVGWSQMLALVGTRLLLDPEVVVGGRTLLPWVVLLLAAAGIHLAPTLDGLLAPPRRPAALVGAVAVGIAVLAGSATLLRDLARPESGWWHVARLDPDADLAAIVEQEGAVPAFTNDQAASYLLTGRLPIQLEIDDAAAERSGAGAGQPLRGAVPIERALRALTEEDGVLIIFTDGSMPAPDPDELVDRHGLQALARGGDWTVLACRERCRSG